MIGTDENRLIQAWHKNREELLAMVSGRMPAFLLSPRKQWCAPARRTPVLVFHEIEPLQFEAQLKFLADNGYHGVDVAELEALLRGEHRDPSAVALTFDDADSTFWTYGLPLLEQYGFKAILCVVPGEIPDDAAVYPNLEDLRAGRATRDELGARHGRQPFCTWRELAKIHAGGRVEIQSHSLLHYRVAVSPKVIDFRRPGDRAPLFGRDRLLSVADTALDPQPLTTPGTPVFRNEPRLAGKRAFRENADFMNAMARYVEERGGEPFFARPGWRRELSRELAKWPARYRGDYETPGQTRAAMLQELVRSREVLQARLPGSDITHFCFPWYAWCRRAVELAGEAGYTSVSGGLNIRHGKRPQRGGPLLIQRIPQEYLYCLPGPGRITPATIWRNRLRGFTPADGGELASQ